MLKRYVEVVGTLIMDNTDIWSVGVIDLQKVPYEFQADTFVNQLTDKTDEEHDYYQNLDGHFTVYRVPVIGDPVSMTDGETYYPCGEIEIISKTRKRITTTDGKTFVRKLKTDVWLFHGWRMINGSKFFVR